MKCRIIQYKNLRDFTLEIIGEAKLFDISPAFYGRLSPYSPDDFVERIRVCYIGAYILFSDREYRLPMPWNDWVFSVRPGLDIDMGEFKDRIEVERLLGI